MAKKIYSIPGSYISDLFIDKSEEVKDLIDLRLTQYRHVKKILDIMKHNPQMRIYEVINIINAFIEESKDKAAENISMLFKYNFINCKIQLMHGEALWLNNDKKEIDEGGWGRPSGLGGWHPRNSDGYIKALREWKKFKKSKLCKKK